MWLPLLVLCIWLTKIEGSHNLTASGQLLRYKIATENTTYKLTDGNGKPVYEMATVSINENIIDNHYLLQSLAHFARERTPNRPVHVKGAGAYGYFEVTHDISDICKAKVFNKIGKRTRVIVRFSNQIGDIGSPDSARDTKGFAVKFYTEEGNLDLVGINFESFNIKDPFHFPSNIHAARANPQTSLSDANSIWDFQTLRRENILHIMDLYGDNGISNSFRHMPGFPIHSFQVYNEAGNISYVRFRFEPDAGVQYLNSSVAKTLSAENGNYYAQDLFESILNGNYPSWTISIQHMTPEDVKNADFNPFDVTLRWPIKQYPPKPIGKLVLDENLKNHFAQNVILSFNPGNLVPGINGAGDKLFESRRFTYLEAAEYRLGVNFYKVKVNCPISGVHTYFRDGYPPVGNNEGEAPNYYPDSFNGPVPYEDKNTPKLLKQYVEPEATNFNQARDVYENLNEGARNRLIENIANDLSSVVHFIQERAIKMLSEVHPDFGQSVANGIKNRTKSTYTPVPIED